MKRFWSAVATGESMQSAPRRREVSLFCDGSCLGSRGVGAWAYLLIDRETGFQQWNGGAGLDTTNNRMELMAVIQGLSSLPESSRVHLVVDSQYVSLGVTERLQIWMARGWRSAATMQHRAEQGLWNGGVRLGYDLDPNNKGVLKVNPNEKVIVVNDFFKKCLELGSAGKVVQHLAKQGIRRKQYTNRNGKVVGGGPYYKQPVMNVLTDKVYLGMIVHNGQAYPGQHEAIVEEDLFMQVQDLIRRNSETRTNALAQEEHVFLLQGLARCGKCGSFMTPKWSSGRGGVRNFYYCCTRQSHSMGTECTTPPRTQLSP